jgi:hypothetical protein
MTKITSIDALIDRMKAAYPHWVRRPLEVRGLMEAGKYSEVYEWLCDTHCSAACFSAEQLLSTIDENGQLVTDKFNQLITQAREAIALAAREPLREQLEADFSESYDFEPAWFG